MCVCDICSTLNPLVVLIKAGVCVRVLSENRELSSLELFVAAQALIQEVLLPSSI